MESIFAGLQLEEESDNKQREENPTIFNDAPKIEEPLVCISWPKTY